jgi:membrane-bound ClpP family serine protease
MTMHRWTILFGLLLAAIGLGGYYFADAKQPMALIPAVLGIAMFVCGVAALIGVIGFVGPLVALFEDIANTAAVLTKGLTSALCLMFVLMCVNSFLEVRRARKAGKNTDEKEELNTDIQDEQDLIS